MTTLLRMLVAALALALLHTGQARAYRLYGPYPFGDEGMIYYNKWGDIHHAGATGGTITWSIMPDGTGIHPDFKQFHDPDDLVSGASSLVAIMNGLGYAEALAGIQRAMDRWSAASNIYFQYVEEVPGRSFNDPAAAPPHTGHIRFGAFDIDAPVGAFGYAPPPNGGTLEGDVILNSNSSFRFAPGDEGDLIDVFNDFESLIMHETGHAVGLDHSETQSVTSLDFEIYKFVNRELDPDDIAAVQFLYGPALAADFDRDNDADAADLTAWKLGFSRSNGAERADGDADRDGDVDCADFLVWQLEARATSAGVRLTAATAPEPSAYVLMSMVAAALAAARSRRSRRGRAPHPAPEPTRPSRRRAADCG